MVWDAEMGACLSGNSLFLIVVVLIRTQQVIYVLIT